MKRDNRTERIAIIFLAFTIVALILVAGTYARYTSTATGSVTATVAKWSMKVNDQQIAEKTAQTFTFDLFDTILDTNKATENEVIDGKIAPGTYGAFNINVLNDSDVDANVAITLEKEEVGAGSGVTVEDGNSGTVAVPSIPLEYQLSTVNTSTGAETVVTAWSTTLPTISDEVLAMTNGEKEIKVEWRWQYNVSETLNADDTTIGIAARENSTVPAVTITATVTATQVD